MSATEPGTVRQTKLNDVLQAARRCGLVINRQVKIGIVRGVVIGYNIARRGRFNGTRYPLLVKTELGVTKCGLHEVVAV
ncbi:hypothetical protein RHDC4_02264 [Rhodocyclaceae bacterium]|nr:hypothetical protein RHDC4_02264 [Rhodocyclaceae bacterium]